jgi:hypothetical protein
MNNEEYNFQTTNLLTKKIRSIKLTADRIQRVVEEGYALAIYPKDKGDFTLWPEPIYLFSQDSLDAKLVEYQKIKTLMEENEVSRTKASLTAEELSRLDFEWFGYYQTCANDALTIDQWTITAETRQEVVAQLSSWDIVIEQPK